MENNRNNDNFDEKIDGFFKKVGIVLAVIVGVLVVVGLIVAISSSSGSKSDYSYDQKYYRDNDTNNDGKINDEEFQNAVDDWMDDHGY